ncbi:sugar-binding domain-containing protein [Saccharicrinis sp. GN24d3]|uniref:sugar-binding domain-containing protein n=1 Tax=Saccharicrinis sp. GN24d3 TaxID=3458416 RepID=UPI0040358280
MFKKQLVISLLSLCTLGLYSQGQDYKTLDHLSGKWKFSLGNKPDWKDRAFDDSEWDDIRVPSSWEMQGFNGYDGYAWYRKDINIPEEYRKESLVLELGYIDDVDEVFFNGQRIGGSGKFPPYYTTAYNAHRLYAIPEQLIYFSGHNVIAVKVYDDQMEGGINRGNVRLLAEKRPLKPFLNLQGEWNFRTGDNLEWRYDNGDGKEWGKIYVPGTWENQGYKRLDGYAWYQKTFVANDNFENDRVVLLLGKIDDLDEVFINGIKIGQTGFLEPGNRQGEYTKAYTQLRGYLVPEGVIEMGKKNSIQVRVSDFYLEGGITEGPIGFITQTDYISYWRKKKENR